MEIGLELHIKIKPNMKWRVYNHFLHLQFMLVVTASSIGEELFYRAAIQVCAACPVSLWLLINCTSFATVWRKQ
jgi:hypothetical protein